MGYPHKVYIPEENTDIKQEVTQFMIFLHVNLKLQRKNCDKLFDLFN